MKIGYLINTFDKPDFAKAQMDIVRSIWEKKFGNILICHTYDGKDKWYSKKYLEDKLIRMDNPGHFEGAANLIDAGVKYLENKVDYIVVSAADTWVLNIELVNKYLLKMQREGYTLLSCPWGTEQRQKPQDVGLAVDFFIIDAKWQQKYKVFPLNYKRFADRYIDILRYAGFGNVMCEKLLFMSLVNACFREIKIENALKKHVLTRYLECSERMPIHYNENWERGGFNKEFKMSTSHERKDKIKFLKSYPNTKKILSNFINGE